MDKKAADIVANDMPVGTQLIFAEFNEGEKYYGCTYHNDIVYAKYGDNPYNTLPLYKDMFACNDVNSGISPRFAHARLYTFMILSGNVFHSDFFT